MRDLLVHTATFARIEAALKPFAEEVSPCVMDDEGEMHRPWGKSEAGAAIAYGSPDAFFSPAVSAFMRAIFACGQLDWFQSSAAGLEHPVLQAIGKAAVRYTSSHAQSEAIAEWVLWAGLDHFQGGSARRRAQAEHRWKLESFREISDTHWLIVGFGAIGEATGRRLRALGAEVTGVRRSGGDSSAADRIVTANALHRHLGAVDAVLLCLPHTPQTENLADAAFFAAMRPGGLFLNVGRGALVDEAALLAGLAQGRPGHAALDVVRQEPQPAEGPFWDHPHVTLTSHLAASTPQSLVRTDAVFIDNLQRFLAGAPLAHEVARDTFA